MPGLFGAVGGDPRIHERMRTAWQRVWPDSETRLFPNGFLGAHAFKHESALWRMDGGNWLAVDGDASIYQGTDSTRRRATSPLETQMAGEPRLSDGVCANAAIMGEDGRRVSLLTEWTGTFPLYYAHSGRGLIFSSHLRPLATVLAASLDSVSAIQFLRSGYVCGGRTPFQGIHRLQPGQCLGFQLNQSLRVWEASRLWTERKAEVSSPDEAAEALLPALRLAIADSLRDETRSVLMMSGGWDSRTLLALTSDLISPGLLEGFSHGDLGSRELRLAGLVCRDVGIAHHLKEIEGSVLDLLQIQSDFRRSETAVFPHWLASGRLLQDLGAGVVFAGVYGEIMGGHYGDTMVRHGWRKMVSFVSTLMSGVEDAPLDSESRRRLRDGFLIQALESSWYLEDSFTNDRPDLLGNLNQVVLEDFDRLERRGVETGTQLVEAFLAEHRGTQYINAQLLSIRARINVSLPFADRRVLAQATAIPMAVRLHNQINQAMLRRAKPCLLRRPLAATFARAGAPLVLQEVTRALRKAYERARLDLHRISGGAVSRPRLGWVDFEFLRDGDALEGVIEDLRAEFWDLGKMRDRLHRIRAGAWAGDLHPVYDQICKIYTLDLMLRKE